MAILKALRWGARESAAAVLSAMAAAAEVVGLSVELHAGPARVRAIFDILVRPGSGRSLVFRLGHTGGTLLAVRADGWHTRQITGTVSAATHGLVLLDPEDSDRDRHTVHFDLSLQEGSASTLQLPFGLPYLADPAHPLTPWDWIPPPIGVHEENRRQLLGGVYGDQGLMAGWASFGGAEVIEEARGLRFLGTRAFLASLTPYEAHNLPHLLDTASGLVASTLPLQSAIEYLLVSPGETSPADDRTTGSPVMPVEGADIPHVAGASPSLAPYLWSMSRSIWGGACRVSGKGGATLEVGLAGYSTIAALRGGGENLRAVEILRYLRNRVQSRLSSRRRKANRLILELAAIDSSALLGSVSALTAEAWGGVIGSEVVRAALGEHGIR
jgi:hypothetical protein